MFYSYPTPLADKPEEKSFELERKAPYLYFFISLFKLRVKEQSKLIHVYEWTVHDKDCISHAGIV